MNYIVIGLILVSPIVGLFSNTPEQVLPLVLLVIVLISTATLSPHQ